MVYNQDFNKAGLLDYVHFTATNVRFLRHVLLLLIDRLYRVFLKKKVIEVQRSAISQIHIFIS